LPELIFPEAETKRLLLVKTSVSGVCLRCDAV
jgi:hypothetical protein